jgi:hypothetical protein
MFAEALAKLYLDGVVEANKLAKASKSLGVKLEQVLEAIERAGISRAQVYSEATTPSTVSVSNGWHTYTLDEAVEVLYNRAVSSKELAEKLGKTEKSVSNFRWRAFRQGFLVPKKLWEAIEAGKEPPKDYGWRVDFAKMLYNLTLYAKARKLTPPKVVLVEE